MISSQDVKPFHCSQSSCLGPCTSYAAGIDAVEIVVDDVSRGVQSHGIVAGVDGCRGGPFGARVLKSWSDEARCHHLGSIDESLQRWLVDTSPVLSPSAKDKSQRSLSCSWSTHPGRMASNQI